MKRIRQFLYRLAINTMLVVTLFSSVAFTDSILPGSVVSYAEVDYMEEMEQRKSLPIQSNTIENWPKGPAIGAQSAILMEMNTHLQVRCLSN